MNCRTAEKLLGPYTDGELPPERAAAMDGHRSACAACREEVRFLRAADKAAGDLEAPPVSERQWEDCWDGIRAGIASAPSRAILPSRWAWTPLAAAAVLFAGVLTFVLIERPFGPAAPGPPAAPRLVQRLFPGRSEVRSVASTSTDYVPVTVVADDQGSTVVWIAEVNPAL